MDIIKSRIEALASEWGEHCHQTWFSSNLSHYLDHPAYRELVALGPEAVPIIMDHYRRDDLPWEFVLQEITGVRMIDDLSAYNPTEVRQRWLDWWADQAQNGGFALTRKTSTPS